MTSEPPASPIERAPGKRWGCLLYALCVVAVLVLVAGMTYFVWYANAKSELDDIIGRIIDRGEPLWFKDLAPKETPPPADDATPLYLLAVSKLKPASKAFYDRLEDKDLGPGLYEEFAAALEANRPALDLLTQASKRPHFRLPIDYETKLPIAILLEPIQEARRFSRLLQAEVYQSIGEGNSDRAVEAVLESLKLSEMLHAEPFIITQLVRYALAAVGIQSLEVLIENAPLTPEQFTAIDEQIERMYNNMRIGPAVVAERCSAFTTIQYLAENLDVFGSTGDDAEQWQRMASFFTSSPVRPYLMQEQAYILKILTDFADAVDKPGEEGSAAVMELDKRVKEDGARSHVLTKLLMPAVAMYRGAGLRTRQRLLNARLGLRIARYRTEHGELPKTLADILDDKLANAVDEYTGLPLIYESNPDGFMLYPAEDSLAVDHTGIKKPETAKEVNTFEAKFAPPKPREEKKPDQP